MRPVDKSTSLADEERIVPGADGASWPEWAQSEYESFVDMVSDTKRLFPCFFAAEAERQQVVAYTWLDAEEIADPKRLPPAVEEFLDRETFKSNRAALSVFCRLPEGQDPEKTFWKLVQHLHDNDPKPWPEGSERDPETNDWGFCFAGERIFINGHSSHHRKRKSRSSTCDLVLFLQRASNVLDVISPDEPSPTQRTIRRMIDEYDDVPHSPELAMRHDDPQARVWRVYWLGDENEERSGTCPLHIR